MNHGRLGRRGFLRGMAAAAALGAARGMAAAAEPSAPRPMKVILWCWDARMTWDDEPEAVSRKMAASEQAFPTASAPNRF